LCAAKPQEGDPEDEDLVTLLKENPELEGMQVPIFLNLKHVVGVVEPHPDPLWRCI